MVKKHQKDMILGFEIGASKIIGILGDLTGNITKKVYEKTEHGETISILISQLWRLKNKIVSEKEYKEVRYISITFPGIIKEGTIVYSPNLPNLANVKFLGLLESRFHKKIYLENDANSQALAQKIFGKDHLSNFVYVTVGSGIGGAIIIDDKLYKGHNGWAGELGHMVIMADGPLCGCNRKGCVEALASGFSITRRAKEKLPDKSSILNTISLRDLDAKAIFNAKKSRDKLATELVEETARYIAIFIANIINIFDPEAIVMGGGVTKNNADFIRLIREKVKAELGYYVRDVKIIKASEKLIEKAPIATVSYFKGSQ
ncbi:MAG: ROK family protein [Thermoplasmata archaeon]